MLFVFLQNSFTDSNTNHCLLCCICFFSQTASHVRARHELLEKAIGVFPEEKQAYERISMLSWILPLIVIIGSLVDTILVVVYMRLAHPWKDILFCQMKKTEEVQSESIESKNETQSKIQVRFSPLYENGQMPL